MESLHNSIDGALTRAFEKDEGFQFKEILVRLMTLALQHWEEATGSSKLELAEKSGIWKVHLDKGYFRVRTLDRYLSVPSLPRYPRWKDVTRTVRFVLNHGTSSVSQELREVLKSFQQQLVRSNSWGILLNAKSLESISLQFFLITNQSKTKSYLTESIHFYYFSFRIFQKKFLTLLPVSKINQ